MRKSDYEEERDTFILQNEKARDTLILHNEEERHLLYSIEHILQICYTRAMHTQAKETWEKASMLSWRCFDSLRRTAIHSSSASLYACVCVFVRACVCVFVRARVCVCVCA